MRLLGVVFYLVWASTALAEECQLDNDALRSMPKVEVSFTRADQAPLTVQAKLADNYETRAAGFQRVCESVIAAEPILFVFQRERTPSFHMHNVVAPIEIAFIRKDGTIDVTHLMQPYSLLMLNKPTYSSNGPVLAAIEMRPGFMQDNGITPDSVMSWEKPK